MLNTGDRAPDFALPDQDGNTVKLSELLVDGPIVLYFYPADFTPGCTKEACTIRDMHDDLTDVGLRIYGVSPQDSASHTKFRDRYSLPFELLADVDKVAVRAYDVDGPLGMGVRRATYLIQADATIGGVVMADLRIGKHGDFLRDAIAQMSA